MINGSTVNTFTVIIPTFNRAENLNRCLNSLEIQTYKRFEVIVCDDGSTDNTKEIVSGYQNKLNLKYFYSENWGGPARPRNLGIENASSNWIFFVDSDDCFIETKIAYFSKMDLNNYDLIYHDLYIIKNDKIINTIKSRQLKQDVYHDLLFNLNAIPTSSVLIRTDLLKKANGFSEDKALIAVEDFDLWLRLCENNNIRTKYVPKALGRYYLGDDNITTIDHKQIDRLKALYKPYIDRANNRNTLNKINSALNYQVGRIHALNSDISNAMAYLLKALKEGSYIIKLKAIYQLISLLKNKHK
jgi:glycosyltransferase involved in cell wall biosynthesis